MVMKMFELVKRIFLRRILAGMFLGGLLLGMTLCQLSGMDTEGLLGLTKDGQTSYQIVMPDEATAVDEYAVKELVFYLKRITGADFPAVKPSEAIPGKPSVYVGASKPLMKILGGDPLAGLQNQEHVARSAGQDILLYGKGAHGNFYAVMEFLEDSLGWRWYSVFEPPILPSRPTVLLEPFNRKKGFSYLFRKVNILRGLDYYYQQKMNMEFGQRVKMLEKTYGKNAELQCFVSELAEDTCVHSLFSYIPPDAKTPNGAADRFTWLEKKDYFATNPKYFSLTEDGKRVPDRQLCFANAAMRAELTKHVLKQIETTSNNFLLDVSAMDNPGSFCQCRGCKALEEKYKSPGGPIYDYLIELCALLKTKHSKVLVKILAYRRSQTQKPPVLPAGEKLPENLVIDFAPIEDNYFADWNHPDQLIQETYSDLKAWGSITHPGNLWAWLYPNAFGTGSGLPVGNIERNINNIRLMHKVGVRGLFIDHCGYHARAGFSELESYLFYKLMQDVDCDTTAIIKEFTDNFYGPAAPLLRQYLQELEAGRKAMTTLPPGVTYHSSNKDDKTFPYLTVGNINRWQTYFDRMESAVAGQPERLLLNVRVARRELDLATLWKWFDLKKAYPDYYTDHMVFANRINAVNDAKTPPAPEWDKKRCNQQANKGPDPVDYLDIIRGGDKSKPLPVELIGVAPDKIRQFVPQYSTYMPGRRTVLDPDAALGYAVPVHMPDLPFNFGFYQWDTKTQGAKLELKLKDITTGEYKLYKLGEIILTPKCVIWFSSRSWATNLELGERLFEPGAGNVWEAYVSIKFDGGGVYGGKADETLMPLADRISYGDVKGGKKDTELVLVDRIILVNKSANQFERP